MAGFRRGAASARPYPRRLSLDIDSLEPADREALDVLLREPSGPHGELWTPATPPIVKLVAWAAWAHHIAGIDAEPTDAQRQTLRFHPDALHVGDWQTVRRIDADPLAPDGSRWIDEEPTLIKLIAWAECGYFLLGGRSTS